jgi:PTS system glucose-specific IIA component
MPSGGLMGLFDFLSPKKKVVRLFAPIDGYIIKLEETPDEAFSQKIVGDGVAIDPTGSVLVAPCNGEIGKIFRTNHAFSLRTEEGAELFVHFGMNTLELEGQGFERIAKEGQKVVVGDPIMKVDLALLKEKAQSVITPVVISNMEDWEIVEYGKGAVKAGESLILEARSKKR